MRIDGRINTNEVSRQNDSYKDLDLSFIAHPAGGDLVKKVGADAIKRSLRNLLFLKKGEIGFSPEKGSGIQFVLFELFTPATVEMLIKEIRNTITAFEPRVDVLEIIVSDEDDLDRNGIKVDIVFVIKNFNEPVTLSVFLERIR